ncbi:MAG: hypothetical protein Q9169_003108 [Polycauliona sp. 2 TL-2023]
MDSLIKSTSANDDIDYFYPHCASEQDQHPSSNPNAEADYASLVALMYAKLPQELLDEIADMVFDSNLCPGFVFLQQHTASSSSTVTWEGKKYDKVRPQLLTVSKSIRAKYKGRIWEENIFIFDADEPSAPVPLIKAFRQSGYSTTQDDHVTRINMRLIYRVAESVHNVPYTLDSARRMSVRTIDRYFHTSFQGFQRLGAWQWVSSNLDLGHVGFDFNHSFRDFHLWLNLTAHWPMGPLGGGAMPALP